MVQVGSDACRGDRREVSGTLDYGELALVEYFFVFLPPDGIASCLLRSSEPQLKRGSFSPGSLPRPPEGSRKQNL